MNITTCAFWLVYLFVCLFVYSTRKINEKVPKLGTKKDTPERIGTKNALRRKGIRHQFFSPLYMCVYNVVQSLMRNSFCLVTGAHLTLNNLQVLE